MKANKESFFWRHINIWLWLVGLSMAYMVIALPQMNDYRTFEGRLLLIMPMLPFLLALGALAVGGMLAMGYGIGDIVLKKWFPNIQRGKTRTILCLIVGALPLFLLVYLFDRQNDYY